MALLNVKQNEDKILGELVLKTDNVLGVSCHHDQILLTHTNKISLLQVRFHFFIFHLIKKLLKKIPMN